MVHQKVAEHYEDIVVTVQDQFFSLHTKIPGVYTTQNLRGNFLLESTYRRTMEFPGGNRRIWIGGQFTSKYSPTVKRQMGNIAAEM